MKKYNVISVFDGIATGKYCLETLNIPIEKYYASEIETQAIGIARYNHPDIIHVGDITKWKTWDIDWATIDLIIGGSPCTNLSSAGNRKGLEGEASSLFYYYYDIYQHIKKLNPDVKFLLENVKMAQRWESEMSTLMGCNPIKLNSNDFSAQNRERLYWTNISDNISFKSDPQDLKDILEDLDLVEDKLFLLKPLNKNSITYDDCQPCRITGRDLDSNLRIPKFERGKKLVQTLCVSSKKPNKSHCLTTVSKDNLLTNLPRDNYSYIYEPECLESLKLLNDQYYIRYYTPIEQERLQRMPDNYTKFGLFYDKKLDAEIAKEISTSRRWETLGNGWTASVILQIFEELKTLPVTLENIETEEEI